MLKKIVFIILGIVFSLGLNFFIIERIIIPDPCYYHSHKTTKLFDYFYDLPSSEGFHPYPTHLNFFITILIGFVLGYYVSIFFSKNK